MNIFRNTIIFILPVILLCAFSIKISAQETDFFKGSERPLFKSDKDAKEQCFVYEKYVVKTTLKENSKTDSSSEGSGYEIDLFRRDATSSPQKNCQTSGKPFMNIKNAEGNEFIGLTGNLIFVKRSVFPDGGNLDVYSLETNKNVFSTEYSEWDNYRINLLAGGRFLSYRQWSKKDGLLKNCREAKKWKREGFGISWLQTKRLDLKTFKETSVGNLRCINIQ